MSGEEFPTKEWMDKIREHPIRISGWETYSQTGDTIILEGAILTMDDLRVGLVERIFLHKPSLTKALAKTNTKQ